MHNRRHSERGVALIYVAVGMLAFMAVSMLAIDVGMLMTARAQAQNAADAGAHAGAVALLYNSYSDRSSSGPAVQSAVRAALANQVMSGVVSVAPADVTFLTGPPGLANRVRVQVYRTAARGNPLTTVIAQYFGTSTADITAVATAEASPANAATCVKPWTIPDRWEEHQDPQWTPSSTFDLYDNKGNPLPNPDVYIPVDQPGYTGYDAERDKGIQVILKPNNANKTAPSFYNEWAIPPNRGGSWYRDNIATCNTYLQPIGDLMTMEPGNKVGPTAQGTQALIDRDANAYWETGCNCVKGSAFSISPRVVTIPLYDPVYYENGKHNGRNASLKVANWIGVFVEGISSGDVTGRITPVSGIVVGSAGVPPAGSFPKAIRIVE